MSRLPLSGVPDIWQVRDTLDDHINQYRHVAANGSGNAQAQAPVAVGVLQGLRIDLFGAVLGKEAS